MQNWFHTMHFTYRIFSVQVCHWMHAADINGRGFNGLQTGIRCYLELLRKHQRSIVHTICMVKVKADFRREPYQCPPWPVDGTWEQRGKRESCISQGLVQLWNIHLHHITFWPTRKCHREGCCSCRQNPATEEGAWSPTLPQALRQVSNICFSQVNELR